MSDAADGKFNFDSTYRKIEAAVASLGSLTALVLLQVVGTDIIDISCGDSEAWVVTDNEVIELTCWQNRNYRAPATRETAWTY